MLLILLCILCVVAKVGMAIMAADWIASLLPLAIGV